MIVTETVFDVELRKCTPVLTQPRRSAEERTALAGRTAWPCVEPGRTLVSVRDAAADKASDLLPARVQLVEVVALPDVADESI
jgi:hypothetical protein